MIPKSVQRFSEKIMLKQASARSGLTGGDFRGEQKEFLHCSQNCAKLYPSRPARGTIMRCHACGTGCGSCGRGRHSHVPGRLLEQTECGALSTPVESRTRSRQIAVDAAVARRLARRTRTVRRTRRPRVIPEAKTSGRSESNPGHASS